MESQLRYPDSHSHEFVLMEALSWSLVPMGTACSTGISLEPSSLLLPLGGDSRKRATSYSRLPGLSRTIPETLAAGGRERLLERKRYVLRRVKKKQGDIALAVRPD